jgi:hypothetical protein
MPELAQRAALDEVSKVFVVSARLKLSAVTVISSPAVVDSVCVTIS